MSVDDPSTSTPVQPPRKVVPPRIWGPAILIILAGLAAATVYGYREHRAVRQLTAQKSEMVASLDATRSLIAALTNRVNELATQQNPDKPAASHPGSAAPTFRRSRTHHRQADDPRWKEIRSQLAEQQKQIEANHQDLGSARTELQGSIARTHDELVRLEKKGERKYYEFDLEKDSQFRRQGPVGLRLHKANTKHQNADLELMIDDVKLSKKHVNLYEPVFFYSADSKQPAELVIISISKNHIHGYVAESKYKSADLEALAGSAGNDGAAVPNSVPGAPAPQPRQRLEAPKN
jgi:hypothetical protein